MNDTTAATTNYTQGRAATTTATSTSSTQAVVDSILAPTPKIISTQEVLSKDEKAVQVRQVTKNLPFLLGSLVMLVVIGMVSFMNQLEDNGELLTISSSNTDDEKTIGVIYERPDDQKPYMYLFDAVSQELLLPEEGQEQQHESEHHHYYHNYEKERQQHIRKIPILWNQYWSSSGWIPTKLMVSKYEADNKYHDIISKLPVQLSISQRRHIYKYFAMADSITGGGWLAHSDTFPLHPFGSVYGLPNNGKFTVYDSTNYPACLLSGNATEWLRMGNLIVEHAIKSIDKENNNPEDWTEEIALKEMILLSSSSENIDENNAVVVDGNNSAITTTTNALPSLMHVSDVYEKEVDVTTTGNHHGSSQWSWNNQDCQLTKKKRAIHFKLGEKEDHATMLHPDDMIIKWLSMWLRICERSTYFIELDNINPPTLTQEEEDNSLIKVGSFHASENYYNETITMQQQQQQQVETNVDNNENIDNIGNNNNNATLLTAAQIVAQKLGDTPPSTLETTKESLVSIVDMNSNNISLPTTEEQQQDAISAATTINVGEEDTSTPGNIQVGSYHTPEAYEKQEEDNNNDKNNNGNNAETTTLTEVTINAEGEKGTDNNNNPINDNGTAEGLAMINESVHTNNNNNNNNSNNNSNNESSSSSSSTVVVDSQQQQQQQENQPNNSNSNDDSTQSASLFDQSASSVVDATTTTKNENNKKSIPDLFDDEGGNRNRRRFLRRR